MSYPDDRRYSPEHEWLRTEGPDGVLGITDFAQDELGDVVFVELPEIGDSFDSGEEIGTIESVKAVAEIYTPVSGEVLAVNESLEDQPELLNSDPHGEGWLVRVKMRDADETKRLMTADEYAELIGQNGD